MNSNISSALAATAPPPEAFPTTCKEEQQPDEECHIPEAQGALGIQEDYVRSTIRRAPKWPKPNVTFLDISPLLADARSFRLCIDSLITRYSESGITHVAGIDARGFTLASALAYGLGCGFIMIRKSGKLPPISTTVSNQECYSLLSEEYEMEYGHGKLELASDLFDSSSTGPTPRVVLIDDLLATGGTALSACNLLRLAGATVVEAAVLIEIVSESLQGRRTLKQKAYIDLFSLLTF